MLIPKKTRQEIYTALFKVRDLCTHTHHTHTMTAWLGGGGVGVGWVWVWVGGWVGGRAQSRLARFLSSH
jgi:hypothetical protein